jgi:hypothetical protein
MSDKQVCEVVHREFNKQLIDAIYNDGNQEILSDRSREIMRAILRAMEATNVD